MVSGALHLCFAPFLMALILSDDPFAILSVSLLGSTPGTALWQDPWLLTAFIQAAGPYGLGTSAGIAEVSKNHQICPAEILLTKGRDNT